VDNAVERWMDKRRVRDEECKVAGFFQFFMVMGSCLGLLVALAEPLFGGVLSLRWVYITHYSHLTISDFSVICAMMFVFTHYETRKLSKRDVFVSILILCEGCVNVLRDFETKNMKNWIGDLAKVGCVAIGIAGILRMKQQIVVTFLEGNAANSAGLLKLKNHMYTFVFPVGLVQLATVLFLASDHFACLVRNAATQEKFLMKRREEEGDFEINDDFCKSVYIGVRALSVQLGMSFGVNCFSVALVPKLGNDMLTLRKIVTGKLNWRQIVQLHCLTLAMICGLTLFGFRNEGEKASKYHKAGYNLVFFLWSVVGLTELFRLLSESKFHKSFMKRSRRRSTELTATRTGKGTVKLKDGKFLVLKGSGSWSEDEKKLRKDEREAGEADMHRLDTIVDMNRDDIFFNDEGEDEGVEKVVLQIRPDFL